jgi:quaternary ammonium compound-resistance protein SugE
MAWVLLLIAGLLETGWAIALKASDGLSKPLPSAVFLVLTAASLVLLAVALRSLPVGTAYAVWTGIGAAGTAILGIVVLGEPAQAVRLASIGLIVPGVIGLNLAGSH